MSYTPGSCLILGSKWKHWFKRVNLSFYIFITKPHDHHIGKVKTIGISNFSVKKIEEILPSAEVIPAVNQVRKRSPHNIHSLKWNEAGIAPLQPSTWVACILPFQRNSTASIFTSGFYELAAAQRWRRAKDCTEAQFAAFRCSTRLAWYVRITQSVFSLTRLFFSSVVHDIVALPKSVTPSRITSNLTGTINAIGKLDKEDIAELDGLAASGKQKR